MINKSRRNVTRFCHYCRRNGHTLQYCRIKAFDDERKRQYNGENQQNKLIFTNDYTREKDQISYHKPTTAPILNTTLTFHKGMVTTIVSRIKEIQILTIRIITTSVTLIKDRISELEKIITIFLQGRITTPTLGITEIFLRTILMLSLTTCSS